MKIFNPIQKLIFRRMPVLKQIASEMEFRRYMERERARADRHGSEFSVIILDAERLIDSEQTFSQMIQTLKRRLRSTDDLGWFEPGRMGILLPETSGKAARALADTLFRLSGMEAMARNFRIYNYPSLTLEEPHGSDRSDPQTIDSSGIARRLIASEIGEIRWPDSGEDLRFRMAKDLPIWKRTIDVAAAGSGLVLIAPFFLIIGAFIKTVSPGPVFFRQTRVGRAERPFTCLKFRTMRIQADTSVHEAHLSQLIKHSDVPMGKLDAKDPRIIPFGRFLRKTGLDELPQLINVLKGEMSLIGPRPCLPNEAEAFLLWHRGRFDTHPGLTGLWQVNGKNKTTFTQMIRFDVAYARTKSFWMDMVILLKTIPAIIEQAMETEKVEERK